MADHYLHARQEALRIGLTMRVRAALYALLAHLKTIGLASDDISVLDHTAALLCKNQTERRDYFRRAALQQDETPEPDAPAHRPFPPEEKQKLKEDGWLAKRPALIMAAEVIIVAAMILYAVLASSPLLPRPDARPNPPNPVPPEGPNPPGTETITEFLLNPTVLLLIGLIALAGLVYTGLLHKPLKRWLDDHVVSRWYDRIRGRLLRRAQSERSPDLPMVVRKAHASLFDGNALHETLRRFRAHRWQPAAHINVSASIRATLAAGGLPTIRFGQRPRLPEYVILCEREQAHDHLPEIGTALHKKMASARMDVRRFEFFGTPDWLYQAEGKRRVTFQSVLEASPDAHVLLLMEAFDCLPEPHDAPHWLKLATTDGGLHLLNPRLPDFWDSHEVALASHDVNSFAATPGGLDLLGRVMLRQSRPETGVHRKPEPERRGDIVAFLARHRTLLLSDADPHPAQIDAVIANLRQHLDPLGFDWLAALALFPVVNIGFTHFAGHVLSDPPPFTHERFLQIARLPWLRVAQFPEWLRKALIDDMDEARREAAAGTIAAFLQGNSATSHDLLQVRRAAQNNRDQRKALARRLAQSHHPVFNDALMVRALEGDAPVTRHGKTGRLEVSLPARQKTGPGPWAQAVTTLLVVATAASITRWQPQAWRTAEWGMLGETITKERSTPLEQKGEKGGQEEPTSNAVDDGASGIAAANAVGSVDPIAKASSARPNTAQSVSSIYQDYVVQPPGPLNIRSQPSLNAKISNQLAAGMIISGQMLNGGQWIKLANGAGYVAAQYVDILKTPPTFNDQYYFDIVIDDEQTRPLAGSIQKKIDGTMLDGRPIKFGKMRFVSDSDWITSAIYCYSSTACAQAPSLAGKLASFGVTARVIRSYDQDDERAGRFMDDKFDLWIGKSVEPKQCNPGPYIVYFDNDRSDISVEAATILSSIITNDARCLIVNISLAMPVAKDGSDRQQMARRRKAVLDHLVARGIPPDKIQLAEFVDNYGPGRTATREIARRRIEITFQTLQSPSAD